MRVWPALLLMSVLAIPASLEAEAANIWRVNGAISGRTFVLDCHLEQSSGVCADATPGGKSHPLASLAAAGNQMSWSFKTRYLFMNISLSFNGRVTGDRMSGTMSAAGRSGTFTAVRR